MTHNQLYDSISTALASNDTAALAACLAHPELTRHSGAFLHTAANNGHHQMAAWLLGANTDSNARGSRQDTPLHTAVVSCDVEMVKLLLSNGADVNICNTDLRTPLFKLVDTLNVTPDEDLGLASDGSRSPTTSDYRVLIASLLIKNGAKTGLQDTDGYTVFDHACKNKHGRLAELLR